VFQIKKLANRLIDLTDEEGSVDAALSARSHRFLEELSRSPLMDEDLKLRAKSASSRLTGLVNAILSNRAELETDPVDTAVVLADQFPAIAKVLIDDYLLKQAVWDMPHRPSFPALGGMGPGDQTIVQAAASADAADIMKIAAKLEDRVMFERGAALLRSGAGLIWTPVGGTNGILLPKEVGYSWMSAGFGLDLSDRFAPTAGFSAGAGPLLATMWRSNDAFALAYQSSAGWSAGIDGVRTDSRGRIISLLAANPVPYIGNFESPSLGDPKELTIPDVVFAIRSIRPTMRDGEPTLEAIPGGSLRLEQGAEVFGVFTFEDGTRVPAELGLQGFEAKISQEQMNQSVKFEGTVGQESASFGPVYADFDPPLALDTIAPRGWIRSGDLADYPYTGHRDASGSEWLHTGDDGSGNIRPEFRGAISTLPFFVHQGSLSFTFTGAEGCRIELYEVLGGGVHMQTESSPAEPTFIEWDLTRLKGKVLALRLIDESSTGSGAVRDFRFGS
jgi:hypothetical protein